MSSEKDGFETNIPYQDAWNELRELDLLNDIPNRLCDDPEHPGHGVGILPHRPGPLSDPSISKGHTGNNPSSDGHE